MLLSLLVDYLHYLQYKHEALVDPQLPTSLDSPVADTHKRFLITQLPVKQHHFGNYNVVKLGYVQPS